MANQRGEGLKAAMKTAGLPDENFLYARGQSSFESGYEGGKVLLENDTPPTAIFAGNDYMAAGVISCARDMGLNVPEDLSVAGLTAQTFRKCSCRPLRPYSSRSRYTENGPPKTFCKPS